MSLSGFSFLGLFSVFTGDLPFRKCCSPLSVQPGGLPLVGHGAKVIEFKCLILVYAS